MSRLTLVVDASVAVKWIPPEEGEDAARLVLAMCQDEELDLVPPYLLNPEVGNVLSKRVRRTDEPRIAAILVTQYN